MSLIEELIDVSTAVITEIVAIDSEIPAPPNQITTADTSKSSVETSFAISNCDCSSFKVASGNNSLEEQLQPPLLPSTTISDEEKESIKRLDPVIKITNSSSGGGDGSDSGVDLEATAASALQRAFSSTSGGYTSSCGGLDEAIGNASCNSSMISFCSDLCDIKSVNTILRHNSNHDCTSEGGSESSSVTGGPISARKSSMARKKVALAESYTMKSTKKEDGNSVARSRSRAASASRAAAHSKNTSGPPNLATKDRARSRDKVSLSSSPITKQLVPQNRSTPIKRPQKPDSLPNGFKDPASPACQKINRSRAPSLPRGRTPGCTPTIEDGRWPSIGGKATPATPKSSTRAGTETPENLIIKTKVGPIILEKSTSVDKYATLPRRRKEKSDEDLRSKNYRSTSAQRDRMSTSLIKRQTSKEVSTPSKSQPPPMSTLHRRNKTTTNTPQKITIYQESSAQTALTATDIEQAFAGIAAQPVNVEAIEKCDKDSQSDIRDKEMEQLQAKLRKMEIDFASIQGVLQTTEQQLTREREEKQAMATELQSNTERVLGMLALVHAAPPADEENCDSLLILESQIQQSGHALEEKQCEIEKLYSFCKNLQVEMHRSVVVQKNLLEEKEEFEKETTELQDFLQDEKSALMDALREAESECEKNNLKLAQRDVDIERLQEECRHLVRISEQRR